MAEDEAKRGITRREFLKDAGLVVGGAAVGAAITYPLVPEKEVIKEVAYVCPYCSEEFASLDALVSHVETEHPAEAAITKFVCPYCGEEFDTLSALESHVEAAHPREAAAEVEGLTKLIVNGKERWLKLEPNWSLMYVLKEKLGLTGVKDACDRGECGTCTVIVDGRAIYSCMMLAIEAEGKEILTIEGLSDGVTLHPIQQSFVDNDAVQCGYCVPGFIMMAKALLDDNPNPTLDEVREGLSGHICTCGNSKRMVEAVLAAKGGV